MPWTLPTVVSICKDDTAVEVERRVEMVARMYTPLKAKSHLENIQGRIIDSS